MYKPPVECRVPFPKVDEDDKTVYDYKFVAEGNGRWAPWSEFINQDAFLDDATLSSITVPTLDSTRYTYLLNVLVQNGVFPLLVGPTGTGKSVYVNDFLKNLSKEKWRKLVVNFSAQTSAHQTQDIIMGKLDKRRKGYYGPTMGQKCVVFVDDLNMPEIEEYGAQPPIELLRQMLDHWNWYDFEDQTKLNIEDVQLVCAQGITRPEVTQRFGRHLHHIAVNEFSEATNCLIFRRVLDWHFGTKGYDKAVTPLAGKIAEATSEVYVAAMANLLPTPAKSHYLFNLRDFARVVAGFMMSPPSVLIDTASVVKLWVHEVYRVFYDRLVDEPDREWFFSQIEKTSQTKFKVSFDELFLPLDFEGKGEVTDQTMRSLIFCDFENPKAEAKVYRQVEDPKLLSVQKVVEDFLEEYNNVSKKRMDLVLFRFAVEHICRISRVVRQPRSHCLLVGVGGSGRQSLTRLAAYVNDFELFQIEMTKTYNMDEWREDLKAVMRTAGEKGEHYVFLFADTQIKEIAYLEDIGNILNSGQVPNIFPYDEFMDICEKMRQVDKTRPRHKKTDGSQNELFALFVERVREYLHIVLTMSPIGDLLRNSLRSFPALVNCCTINWFQAWPADALEIVAQRFLEDVEMPPALRQSCVSMCQTFHESTRSLSARFQSEVRRINYVTPTSYLGLINTYKELLANRRKAVSQVKKRYEVGLEKLLSAEGQVEGMKIELIALQPKLVVAQKETADTMVIIEKSQKEAAAKKEVVQKDEALANEQATAAKSIKDECDADLAEAIPILNGALKALDTLKPSDIGEVKAMKSPPDGVRLVMETVCILRGVKPEKINDPAGGPKKIVRCVIAHVLLAPPSLDALGGFRSHPMPIYISN